MGLLAGLGVDPVEVVRRPRVSVLSTGDELVEPQRGTRSRTIRDANRFSLIAALKRARKSSGRGVAQTCGRPQVVAHRKNRHE